MDAVSYFWMNNLRSSYTPAPFPPREEAFLADAFSEPHPANAN